MAEKILCEITSADIPGILGRIYGEGIEVWELVQRDDLTLRLLVGLDHADRLQALVARRGGRMKKLRRFGLSAGVRPWLRHPILLTAISLLILLTIWLPTRVLFVRVEGNQHLPAQRILEQAESCGIRFGSIRREVRSEKMKNALLEAMPMLQWAGVNTSGCVATITVRERSLSAQNENTPVSEIVASRDGVIRSCTVIDGRALCSPGQAVREGQVLVSGLTDCGLAILVTGAEAEVYAETSRHLTAVTAPIQRDREVLRGERKNISLLIGKKRINFYKDSGILDGSCVKMYSEYYMMLPGGFYLPLGIGVETVQHWETREAPVGDASRMLEQYCRQYLLDHMSAGQILEQQSTLAGDSLHTDYICLEMIGQNRYEEFTKDHGKNDGENG